MYFTQETTKIFTFPASQKMLHRNLCGIHMLMDIKGSLEYNFKD